MNSLWINILEFLYNNIITVAIISTAFTLLYVTLRLSYLEIKFNRQLSIKKILFGQRRQFKYRTFNNRRIFALILSVMLIALILVRAYGAPQVIFVRHTSSLDSNEQASRFYEDFFSKFFSNPLSPNLTSPQPGERPFEDVRSDHLEGLDFVIETQNQVFVLNLEGLQVLDFVNGRLDYFTTISLDTPECPIERQTPLGMTIINNQIIIVSSKSLGQCVTNPRPYELRDNLTVIQVVDLSLNYAITETIKISGHLTNARAAEGQLLISTNQWIPFADSNFNLGNYLPYFIRNNRQTMTPINDIRYIENTSPNSFVTLTLIDFARDSVNQVSLFSDYRNEVIFRKDAVLLAFDQFEFFAASDIFEFRNPVESMNTAVVQLNIFNEDIYFFRAQIAEGNRVESGSLFLTDEGLIVMTQSRFGRGLAHFYNTTLRYDNQQALNFIDPINQIRFENNYFYISLDRQQTNHYLYEYNPTGQLELVATQNEATFGDFARIVAPETYLTLRVFDNQRFELRLIRQNQVLPFLKDEIFSVTGEPVNDLFEGSSEILNSIIYDSATQRLTIPIYALSSTDSSRRIQIYNTLRSNQAPVEIDMTRIGEFQSPFVYRVVERNGRIYHITPGGFRETLSQNPENIIRRFSFPSP